MRRQMAPRSSDSFVPCRQCTVMMNCKRHMVAALALVVVASCRRHHGGDQLQARTSADCYALAYGVRLYVEETARLPSTLTELTNGASPYVARLREDSWGNAFMLLTDRSNQFVIVSKGKDGQLGTMDDIMASAQMR